MKIIPDFVRNWFAEGTVLRTILSPLENLVNKIAAPIFNLWGEATPPPEGRPFTATREDENGVIGAASGALTIEDLPSEEERPAFEPVKWTEEQKIQRRVAALKVVGIDEKHFISSTKPGETKNLMEQLLDNYEEIQKLSHGQIEKGDVENLLDRPWDCLIADSPEDLGVCRLWFKDEDGNCLFISLDDRAIELHSDKFKSKDELLKGFNGKKWILPGGVSEEEGPSGV